MTGVARVAEWVVPSPLNQSERMGITVLEFLANLLFVIMVVGVYALVALVLYSFVLNVVRTIAGAARQGWDAADRRQRADPLGPDEDEPDSRR